MGYHQNSVKANNHNRRNNNFGTQIQSDYQTGNNNHGQDHIPSYQGTRQGNLNNIGESGVARCDNMNFQNSGQRNNLNRRYDDLDRNQSNSDNLISENRNYWQDNLNYQGVNFQSNGNTKSVRFIDDDSEWLRDDSTRGN